MRGGICAGRKADLNVADGGRHVVGGNALFQQAFTQGEGGLGRAVGAAAGRVTFKLQTRLQDTPRRAPICG
ncbi:hypothetical protein D3C79_885990 [compost metagenome]